MKLSGLSAILHSLGLVQSNYKPSATVPTTPHPNSVFRTGPAPNKNIQPDTRMLQVLESKIPRNDLCAVEPYDAPVEQQTFSFFDQAHANVYRYRQQQSVNLGSWFVQESWMKPSLFACASGSQISELDVASGWNSTKNSRAVLERHWDTFITRSDFEYLASIGINTVRLPIGYWSLGPSFCQDTPFAAVSDVYANSWNRVLRAINMAADAGIGVLVDLHAAVGSQNGQPHSGISDGVAGLFGNQANIDKTMAVLDFLMTELSDVTNVVGIQILNEPVDDPNLPDFYSQAITSMRQASPNGNRFPLYLHNAFNIQRFTDYVAARNDFVVQDHHSYFVFTPSDAVEAASQHTGDVKSSIATSYADASNKQHRNMIIGEWSCALTDASLASGTDPNEAQKEFCTAQMGVYSNSTAGWSFWSYLTENCGSDHGWCFKAAVGKYLPSSFFAYGRSSLSNVALGSLKLPTLDHILSTTKGSVNSTPKRRHRFTAIHRRQTGSLLHAIRDGYDSDYDRISHKGYADGFYSAVIFASYGQSKLGFTGQYIMDSLNILGPGVVPSGAEEFYKQSFMKGLKDGEDRISSLS